MTNYTPDEVHMATFDTSPQFADGRSVYNFCAGPCVLPKVVLDRCTEEMYDFRGTGQSVMELSHRQNAFRFISIMTKREIKRFLKVPDNFRIMIQQGGATNQYTAIVKNLIGLKPHGKAMAVRSGMWSN